jgi:hypothetical protein
MLPLLQVNAGRGNCHPTLLATGLPGWDGIAVHDWDGAAAVVATVHAGGGAVGVHAGGRVAAAVQAEAVHDGGGGVAAFHAAAGGVEAPQAGGGGVAAVHVCDGVGAAHAGEEGLGAFHADGCGEAAAVHAGPTQSAAIVLTCHKEDNFILIFMAGKNVFLAPNYPDTCCFGLLFFSFVTSGF